MMPDLPDKLREFISKLMVKGFESVHEVVADAKEFAHEKYGQDFELQINRLVSELLADQFAAQTEWTTPTDCDRLDTAFAALNAQGIVARQNFSCCNNCGFAEIWDEVDEVEKQQAVKGYAFYHLQCTERAIKTGQLLIAYGTLDEDMGSLNSVVSSIITELRNAGLTASWAGTLGHPIVVEGIVWQRRR